MREGATTFSPQVAKAQTKAAERPTAKLADQRATLAARPLGGVSDEQAHMLQGNIGNQATLPPLVQRARNAAENEPHGQTEQKANPGSQIAATPGVSWDFSKISLFPPDQAGGSQVPPPLAAPHVPLVIQTKLAIGRVDDPLEHEADQVADRVMRMPNPVAGSLLQRNCATCDEETVQRKSEGGAVREMAAPSIVHDVLQSPGQPLDAATRAYMEPRFGHDFSRIRVHADSQADASARAVNAVAYTVGQDVVFQAGALAPETADGRRLLAHELAHVVQQSNGSAPGAVRRAVAITKASFTVTNNAAPSLKVSPSFIPGKWSIDLTTDAPGFVLDSAVNVACGGGSAAGYEVGIVQFETSESSRATYFGVTPADGSLVASKSQKRKPAGPCSDSRPGAFWTAGATGEISSKPPACGAGVALPTFKDMPGDSYPGWFQNALTKKPNYIRDVTANMRFTDALAVKTPAGSINILNWLTWGIEWAGTYQSDASGSVPSGPLQGSSFWAFGDAAARPSEIPTSQVAPAKTCVEIAMEQTSSDYVMETNASY